MSTDATQYVVLGVAITYKEEVKKFFSVVEEHYKFIDGFRDSGYNEEITPTESGIHIISDGMSGKYVVVGKIIAKGIERGLPFTEISTRDITNEYRKGHSFYSEVLKVDQALGTNFGDLDANIIAFTHWH